MRHVLFAFLVLAGCGDPTSSLDPCIEDRVTIARGVYGQVVNGCDTPDCTASYAEGAEIRIYDADPTPPGLAPTDVPYDWGTSLTPIARGRADERGFYEIALASGTVYHCSTSCDVLTLSEAAPLARRDFASGPGGGLWNEGVCR